MQKQRLLWIVALAGVLLLLLPRPAHAYMDPGTTGSIFALLAPFFTVFLAFLGFLIRPIRRFFASIITKVLGGSRAESITDSEQSVSGDLPDDKSEENAGEDPRG
jgi:hypothetical protein